MPDNKSKIDFIVVILSLLFEYSHSTSIGYNKWINIIQSFSTFSTFLNL
jgi:hypothetical protein